MPSAYKPGLKMPAKNEFQKNEYRIYKPLFLDPANLKRDLDREFEAVSQALIWVTQELKELKEKVK